MPTTITVLDSTGATQTVATNDAVIAKLPAALGAGSGLKIDGSGTSLPISIADGADVAEGAKADAAYAGSGSASVVALLKGLYTAMIAATPIGANVIGGITIADGSNIVEGAIADAAATAGGTGTISAKLRRISTQLAAALGQTTKSASMPVVLASDDDVQAKFGIVTETAPASDTASSGLNGRLQRIAQNITSLLNSTAYSSSSRLPVLEPDGLSVSGSQSSAAVLFTQDMVGYGSITVQVTSAGTTCTVNYETSDDNTNWLGSAGIISSASGNSNPASTSTTVSLITFPKRGRYFRARVGTYTSGTVTVVGNCHKNPLSLSNRITLDGSASQAGSVISSGIHNMLGGQNAAPTAVTNGQGVRNTGTLLGAAIVKQYSIPELDWAYAAGTSGIVNSTTAVTIIAAGAAGVKNYLTNFTLDWDTLGVATEVVIRNGAAGTVIWRGKLQTASGQRQIILPTPLQSSAATLLEFATITASVTGGVFVNAQGYQAAD